MHIVAGVDLGGTAVNYTLVDYEGRFLIDGLCEHPARAVEGPDVCLKQTVEGLNVAVTRAGASLSDVTYVGLDTPGPASAGRTTDGPLHCLDRSPENAARRPPTCQAGRRPGGV